MRCHETPRCAHLAHRTASRRERQVTVHFTPLSVRPWTSYSVKTHMIISRSILTTARRAIFQCGIACGAVFCEPGDLSSYYNTCFTKMLITKRNNLEVSHLKSISVFTLLFDQEVTQHVSVVLKNKKET